MSAPSDPAFINARRRVLAEFIGTFAMVFAGTGAMVINTINGGVIGHAGVALTFGLVVMAMIHTFGDVSGAHMNPAVTVAFAAAGRFAWRDVPAYLLGQLAGAFAASGMLRVLFSADSKLGATLRQGRSRKALSWKSSSPSCSCW